jgi:hypothetical protein
MPTTTTPNPTDLREPVYDPEEIFNETGCPDSAAAVDAIARVCVWMAAIGIGLVGWYLFLTYVAAPVVNAVWRLMGG